MNCSEIEELMAAYVSGEIGRTREQAVATHLLSCASCRAWHDDVRAAWGLWEDGLTLGPDALPAAAVVVEPVTAAEPDLVTMAVPDLVTPVMQRVRQPRPVLPTLPLRHALVHYGVAASVAMILFSTGLMDRYGERMLHLQAGFEQAVAAIAALLSGGAL